MRESLFLFCSHRAQLALLPIWIIFTAGTNNIKEKRAYEAALLRRVLNHQDTRKRFAPLKVCGRITRRIAGTAAAGARRWIATNRYLNAAAISIAASPWRIWPTAAIICFSPARQATPTTARKPTGAAATKIWLIAANFTFAITAAGPVLTNKSRLKRDFLFLILS